ncbi:MAG: transcriptional regulator [Euryarchaeota archaeon]|nr:transcriptional regulator [Euryarchaeota archaeon]
MRAQILEETRRVLATAGFSLSEKCDVRPLSFDVIARRGEEMLVVKVLTNVDSISENVASELRVIAKFIGGTPLLVGERSSAGDLEQGALYVRHGVTITSLETLEDFLVGETPPLVFAGPGGFYVHVDGATLRRLREERAISLGQLAEVAGVSRRAIAMYEEGMNAMVDVVLRMEEFLEAPISRPLDPFAFDPAKVSHPSRLENLQEGLLRDALLEFRRLGYDVAETQRSPFSAVSAARKTLIFTGVSEGEADFKARARALADIAGLTGKHAVFVVREMRTKTSVEGTALVGETEMEKMDSADEMVSVIEERRKKTE